ncbi:MAG TPA: thioredoxin family protein [Candidatus Dormibacteraeota bacterium]|nr:thioredoxin family protein [Candidatus Dormibacteraeota bacterium]
MTALIDRAGNDVALETLAGDVATVVVFVANGCPTARAYVDRLVALHDTWAPSGVSVVAVNSNNSSLSPPDTPAEMAKSKFPFPYLKDEGGSVARKFDARCTPHAFLLDREMSVVYSGRIDDSRLGDRITARDLNDAISALVAGRPVPLSHTEPFGCSIVW